MSQRIGAEPRQALLLFVSLLLLTAAALAPAQAVAAPATGSASSASSAVAAQLRADAVPIAAWAVVSDGQVITGARGDGVDDTTPFVLGSVSKSFTALAVLQLVDTGRMQLDAPAARYLPHFRTADPTAVITIEQLLTQTSGLPTSAGTAIVDHPDASLEQRVDGAADVHLVSAPGSTFHYSNLNYAILGRVVEEVSGVSFGDYVQEHIFEPLDMTGSYTSVAQARAHGLPSASTVWFGVTVPRSTPDYPGGAPDGFLVSTARDMARYLRFQLSDGALDGVRVVSEQSMRRMHTAAVSTEADVAAVGTHSYAMGWGVGEVGGRPLVAHDGDCIGYHANVVLLPAESSGLVVLTARNGALTAPNGPATAGTTVLQGTSRGGSSHEFLTTYVVLDVVVLLVVVLLVRLLLRRDRRQRISGAERGLRPWRALCVSVVVDLAVAAGVYVGVFWGLATAAEGFPVSLRFAFGFIGPDVTTVVLITCAVFVGRALLLALAALRSARTCER